MKRFSCSIYQFCSVIFMLDLPNLMLSYPLFYYNEKEYIVVFHVHSFEQV